MEGPEFSCGIAGGGVMQVLEVGGLYSELLGTACVGQGLDELTENLRLYSE